MRCLFLVFFSRLLFFLPLSISDCFNLIHRLHLQSVLSITIPLLLHHLSSSSVPFFLCSLSLSLSLCPHVRYLALSPYHSLLLQLHQNPWRLQSFICSTHT